jgi:phosphoserine phosphatase RsbU/P
VRAPTSEPRPLAAATRDGAVGGAKVGHHGRDLGRRGREVGGDFYDVFALDENRTLIVLGDVRGHGVQAAGTALLIRHLIRAAAVHLPTSAAILAQLNTELLRHDPEGPDADPRFATAVLALAQPGPDGAVTITLALAGHPRPLLREDTGAVQPVGTPGSLVGATEIVSFTDTTVTPHPRASAGLLHRRRH